jgi:excisionase family DNA binding protein
MFHAVNQPVEAVSNSAILNKQEVAALLKVSPRYVERQVRSGRLRALRLSHKVTRFHRRDVETFLASTASSVDRLTQAGGK